MSATPKSFWASRGGFILARGFAPAVFLLGVVCFTSAGGRFESFPLDDAWIHRVYARSFAAGHGFEYNAGVQEAGATSPLWVIVTSPAHWLEFLGTGGVVFGVKLIGVMLGFVTVVVFQRIVRRVTNSPAVAVAAACLLSLEPRFLFSSLSGMETGLLVALWLGGLLACIEQRWWWYAILLSLTPVTRPESLVLLPFGVVVLFVSARGFSTARKALASVVLGAPFAAWILFSRMTNGHWLPNTYYLKAHPVHLTYENLSGGWQVVSAHGFASLFIFLVGLAVFVIYACAARRHRLPVLAFMVVGALAYWLGVVGTREVLPHGYYWTRWIDPASILLTASFAAGYSVVLAGNIASSKLRAPLLPRLRIASMTAGAVGLAVCIPAFASSFADRRSHLLTDSRAIYELNVRAGLWIDANTPRGAVVGVNDAGAIKYFGGRYTIDLVGMNNQNLTFGRVKQSELLLRCDWLAIFPSAFRHERALIERHFELVKVFEVRPAEYTVCDCPGQTTKAILKKTSEGPTPRTR